MMKNFFCLVLLLVSFNWIIAQNTFVQSQGGVVTQSAGTRHECIVGQSTANVGNITSTGKSGNIGFLNIESQINTAPTANAGEDDLHMENTIVQLDGSLSFDPQGNTLMYNWESLDNLSLNSTTGSMPSFNAPDVLARRKFRFVLTVSDGELTSSRDTVVVEVYDDNWLPVIYTNSTVTYALVTINGETAEECDVVGAYVNGECRAVTEVILFEEQAYAVFNTQTELPEEVNYRVYDYSLDQVCDATETSTTIPGGELGSFDDPILIEAICGNSLSANFQASTQETCQGESVFLDFSGFASDQAEFNWFFDGATVLSGEGEGPYEINWNETGEKTITLEVNDNGQSSNMATSTIIVNPNEIVYLTEYTCSPQDTMTETILLENRFGCDSTIVMQRLYEPVAFSLNGAGNYCGESFVAVEIQSGIGDFSYNWSTGDTAATLTGIPNGNYFVTITDGNECTYLESIEITSSPALDASIEVISNPDCSSNFGSATVEATGGFGPYTIQWDNGETTSTADSLTAGAHIVIIEDIYGCSIEQDVFILPTTNFPFISEVDIQNYFCASAGSIDVTISQGTAPFSYLWSNGASTESIVDLVPGDYSLTVTDIDGCIATVENLIVENEGDSINFFIDQQDCMLMGVIANGQAPYNYNWSNGVMINSINTVFEGEQYSLSITDANGCFGVDTIIAETGINDAVFEVEQNNFDINLTPNVISVAHLWDFGDGTISTDSMPVHSFMNNGMYDIQHITFSPCGNDTFSIVVNINVVSIYEVAQNNRFNVFPNPFSDEVTIEFSDENSSPELDVDLRVFDVIGQLITYKKAFFQKNKYHLDLGGLPKGIYQIVIQSKNIFWTQKIIKST